jgi:hypothetical protein
LPQLLLVEPDTKPGVTPSVVSPEQLVLPVPGEARDTVRPEYAFSHGILDIPFTVIQAVIPTCKFRIIRVGIVPEIPGPACFFCRRQIQDHLALEGIIKGSWIRNPQFIVVENLLEPRSDVLGIWAREKFI